MMVVAYAALSCSNRDEIEPDKLHGRMAYMAITTRAQGATNSLNQDTQDNEDKVDHLRLMAFERATGKAVYNKVHPIAHFVGYAEKVPMPVGEYDFCFVANETTELAEALNKITFKDGLYYDDILTKIAYKGVNDKPTLFLMTSEVQSEVRADNTLTNPLQLNVELVRCLAKIDLNMVYKENMTNAEKEATKGLKITHIIFKNLPTSYSLFPPKTPYNGVLKTEDDYTAGIAAAQYSDEGVNPVLRRPVYMPEYLRAATASEDTKSTIEVHYAKHGIERKKTEVEINHQNWNQPGDHYTPTNTAALSTKSIVRNTSYALSGILKGWAQESITFDWQILPWTLIKSFKEFAAVIVHPTIDTHQPNLDVQGEGNKELLWHSGGTDGLKLKFDIEAPVGGVWRFTITNRIDFDLKGIMVNTGTPAISGIAGSGPVELTITPTKPWQGNIRSTELYLTINGVEVQIVPDLITQGVEPGPTNRFLIKQSN